MITIKRLSKYFRSLQSSETSYRAIYEGSFFDPSQATRIYDPIYWHDDVAFHIQRTHKQTPDKPCITIKIPLKRLGIHEIKDQTVLADFALRDWIKHIDALNEQIFNRSRSEKANGAFYCFHPTHEVLKRNASFVETFSEQDYLCIMIIVQLPQGKKDKSMRMLCKMLPKEVDRYISMFDLNRLNVTYALAETQNKIREWLKSSDYCAFVANGSVLPRNKDDNGFLKGALPFVSPKEDEIEICGLLGMGIKRGVTVITGGGYSGKSTFLDAINAGINNHIIGDGREFVITDETAMEISAEEGRSIKNMNITPFIKWIPDGSTEHFSTDHASGSTSQAANIMEAIHTGCKLILIDEDRSATNFMIQDSKMRSLIQHEPITPFTERVKELNQRVHVSTILVIGGSGEFLNTADQIYLMDHFVLKNVTEQAKELCISDKPREPAPQTNWEIERKITSDRFSSYPQGSGSEKFAVSTTGYITFGNELIETRGLYNITSQAQLTAVLFIIRKIALRNQEPLITLADKINEVLEELERNGIDSVFSSYSPDCERWLELPRMNEIIAVINRMRHVNFIS